MYVNGFNENKSVRPGFLSGNDKNPLKGKNKGLGRYSRIADNQNNEGGDYERSPNSEAVNSELTETTPPTEDNPTSVVTTKTLIPSELKIDVAYEADNLKTQGNILALKFVRNSWQANSLRDALQEAEDHLKAAQIYKDILIQFISMSSDDKIQINNWVKNHEKSVRKLNSAKDLEKIAKKTNAALALTNKEIVFWKDLAKTGLVLKPYIKSAELIDKAKVESPIYNTEVSLPSFEPQPLNKYQKGVHLTNKHTVAFGESELVTTLYDYRDTLEKITVDNFYLEGQIQSLKSKIKEVQAATDGLQKDIKELLKNLSSKEQKDAAVISVLVKARPERFVGAETIYEALSASFKRLSDVETPSPEQEADQYLKEMATKSEKLLKRLEDRNKVLRAIKENLNESNTSLKELGEWVDDNLRSKLMTALPWLVAAILIYKLRMKG